MNFRNLLKEDDVYDIKENISQMNERTRLIGDIFSAIKSEIINLCEEENELKLNQISVEQIRKQIEKVNLEKANKTEKEEILHDSFNSLCVGINNRIDNLTHQYQDYAIKEMIYNAITNCEDDDNDDNEENEESEEETNLENIEEEQPIRTESSVAKRKNFIKNNIKLIKEKKLFGLRIRKKVYQDNNEDDERLPQRLIANWKPVNNIRTYSFDSQRNKNYIFKKKIANNKSNLTLTQVSNNLSNVSFGEQSNNEQGYSDISIQNEKSFSLSPSTDSKKVRTVRKKKKLHLEKKEYQKKKKNKLNLIIDKNGIESLRLEEEEIDLVSKAELSFQKSNSTNIMIKSISQKKITSKLNNTNNITPIKKEFKVTSSPVNNNSNKNKRSNSVNTTKVSPNKKKKRRPLILSLSFSSTKSASPSRAKLEREQKETKRLERLLKEKEKIIKEKEEEKRKKLEFERKNEEIMAKKAEEIRKKKIKQKEKDEKLKKEKEKKREQYLAEQKRLKELEEEEEKKFRLQEMKERENQIKLKKMIEE